MTGTQARAGTDLRIGDLRRPVHTPAALAALAEAELHPVELTERAVLDAATGATGLTDFGPDDFRPRLRAWLRGAAEDPDLLAFARGETFRSCVLYASIRLRLHDLLRRHPEIEGVRLDRPIVVVGPWRSGTTHLHGLLAADSRLRALRYREIHNPFQPPAGDLGECAVLPNLRGDLLPLLSAMHPLGPDDVAEEITLQGANFPDGGGDPAPHYAYLRRVLQAMRWADPAPAARRWVLKSPPYCMQLGPLLATFPDAVTVLTHRDPVAVVQSVATRFAYGHRLRYAEVNTGAILEMCAGMVEQMLRARIADEALIPPAQKIEVYFHEFMADQDATLARIHAAAGLPPSPADQRRVTGFRAAHARHRAGRISYDLRTDFGIDPARLHDRFAFYYDRHPVLREVC